MFITSSKILCQQKKNNISTKASNNIKRVISNKGLKNI